MGIDRCVQIVSPRVTYLSHSLKAFESLLGGFGSDQGSSGSQRSALATVQWKTAGWRRFDGGIIVQQVLKGMQVVAMIGCQLSVCLALPRRCHRYSWLQYQRQCSQRKAGRREGRLGDARLLTRPIRGNTTYLWVPVACTTVSEARRIRRVSGTSCGAPSNASGRLLLPYQ